MLNELDMLENKVAQVVSLCRALRSENNLLRQQLASAESEKIRLRIFRYGGGLHIQNVFSLSISF